jgi:hypothetical protein
MAGNQDGQAPMRDIGKYDSDGVLLSTPDEKSVDYACGTVSSTGGVTVVNSPASGKRIVITRLKVQNESATETLAQVKAASTVLERLLLDATKGTGETLIYPIDARPKGGDAEAISIDLDGANQVGYTIHYYEEDV